MGGRHIKLDAGFLQEAAGFGGWGLAFFGEIGIGPAGETVFAVPSGLAVTHEDNFVHGAGAAGVRLRESGSLAVYKSRATL